MTTFVRLTASSLLFGLLACAGAAPPPAPGSPASAGQKCDEAAEPTAARAATAGTPASEPSPSRSAKTPEEALVRLFTAPKIDASWFTSAFVAEVPPSKIEAFVRKTKDEAGAFTKVETQGDKLYAVLSKGKVPTSIHLDAEGRIRGLWFAPMELAIAPRTEDVVASFEGLPGKVSYLVLSDGTDIAARDADVPMAVGSAFKLAILDALRERIASKKAQWTDIVRLDPKNKSLPSGSLQKWPDRAPLTIHTLASMMISVSDNTATDTLLDYVGRDAVEKRAPGNAPFMSTRDAFVLKEKKNRPLLERWRAADAPARRRMLEELKSAKLQDGDHTEPTIDVEWMFSARKLCELMSRNASLDVMHINPGLAEPRDWDLAAYKGGSEPGVLNFTTWVEKAGKKHCVVTTWNDAGKEVEDEKLAKLHRALLRSVRDGR